METRTNTCDCGQPSALPMWQRTDSLSHGCARCLAAEEATKNQSGRSGVRQVNESFHYADIVAACDRFLKSRGLHPGVSHHQIYSISELANA